MIYIDRNQPRSLFKAVTMLEVNRTASREAAQNLIGKTPTDGIAPQFPIDAVHAAHSAGNPFVLAAYALYAEPQLGQRQVLSMLSDTVIRVTGDRRRDWLLQGRVRRKLRSLIDSQLNESGQSTDEKQKQRLYAQTDRLLRLRRQLPILRLRSTLEDTTQMLGKTLTAINNARTATADWVDQKLKLAPPMPNQKMYAVPKTLPLAQVLESQETPQVRTVARIPGTRDGFEILYIIPASKPSKTRIGRWLDRLATHTHQKYGWASPYGNIIDGLIFGGHEDVEYVVPKK